MTPVPSAARRSPVRARYRLLLVALVLGCADAPPAGTLEIELLLVPGSNPLANADFLRMQVDDGPEHTWPLTGNGLQDVDFDVEADGQAHQLRVTGLDAAKRVVARGTSPPVIFEPGTRARLTVVPRAVEQFSTTLGGLLAPRAAFAVAGDLDNGFAIIGGLDSLGLVSTVERVHPYLTILDELPPLPVGRRAPVAARASTAWITAFGGEATIAWLADGALEWQTAPAVGIPVFDAAVAAVGPDEWLAFGGVDPTAGATAQVVRIRWDGAATTGAPATTEAAPDLLTPRDRPAAMRLGEDILIVGGSATLFGETAAGTPVGETITSPPVASVRAVALPDRNQVLVIDGESGQLFEVDAGLVVHPAGQLTAPRPGSDATRLVDGRILVSGGQTAPGTAVLLARSEEGWETVETLALTQGRTHHRSIAIADRNVLLIGGTGSAGTLWLGDVYVPR